MTLVTTALPLAVDLADAAALTPAVEQAVGRKAASLAAMLRAGLPVPPAYALTTAAWDAMLAGPAVAAARAAAAAADEAGRASAIAGLAQAIAEAPLPPAVAAAVRAAYAALGGRVAVRSSGVAEDLEGASFAGMYETYLDLEGEAAVLDAVRRCWASAYAPRVLDYATRRGLAMDDLAMGVAIQRLIPADVAGVLFTLDPTSGEEGHMRAEACFGLGEALVGGHVTPDSFVLARADGAIVDATIVDRPTLDAAQAADLAALGRKLQAYFQAPQDVEWAIAEGRLWLLQSRPITAISYRGVEGEWTTADFKDGGVSASVCAPYMWSLYDSIWQWSMPHYLKKIKLLRHSDPVVWGRVFYGRPYWNVGEVKRCLHLVPGFNERNFDRDLGIEGAYAGDGVVIPTNAKTVLRALPVLFALEADYKERLKLNEAFVKDFERLAAAYEPEPGSLPRHEQVLRFRKLVRDDYFKTESAYFLTIYNTSNAKLDFKVELDKANQGGEPPLSYLELLSGLQGLKHLDPLKDLWALAGRVCADEALANLVAATPAEGLAAALQAAHPAFWAELAAFLTRYRHHSVAELDITQPRWDEDPTFVLRTLKAYVAQHDPARDPAALNQRQHDMYLAERRRAEARFRARGIRGFFAARAFFAKLDLLRRYSWWREEMRDRSSRMYALIRRETLALGRLLAREEALERAEDIWLLTWQEALSLAEGGLAPGDARTLVATRREDGDGWRGFTNPNELGRRFKVGGGGAAPAGEAPPGGHVGIPCSPGRVTAVARVVPTIHDAARLGAGEILVTRFTDPGWTPLFSGIAGVVTETGGVLSHAAVIAREYGIPAVLAVPGATTRIRDGERVVLDGEAGTIAPAPDA